MRMIYGSVNAAVAPWEVVRRAMAGRFALVLPTSLINKRTRRGSP